MQEVKDKIECLHIHNIAVNFTFFLQKKMSIEYKLVKKKKKKSIRFNSANRKFHKSSICLDHKI